MTNEQKVVLSLVRKAINPEAYIQMPKEVDWAEVIKQATSQGVLGLCFEAVEKLSHDQRPEMENLMDMLGQVEYMKSMYEEHRRAIASLADFYASCGLKMMLLKGYGLSLYWPTPEHRPVGDIDIYLFEEGGESRDGKECKEGDKTEKDLSLPSIPLYQKADRLISEKLGIAIDDGHEHHTCFNFMGLPVENHYDFVNTKVNESSRELEVVFKRLAEETFLSPSIPSLSVGEPVEPSIPNLYLPSPTLNALFLIRHMGQHFAGAEASLRQLLDWGFFMRYEAENVDWDLVTATLKKVGMYRFFVHVNAICVDFLGFPSLPFSTFEPFSTLDRALEKRILEDILQPEFAEVKPKGNVVSVIAFKTRRFFANRWKRNLVYRESMWSQLIYGSMAHLKRFRTIQD